MRRRSVPGDLGFARLFLAALLCAGIAGCDDGSNQGLPSKIAVSPSTPTPSAPACDNQEAVADDPDARVGSETNADVDDDGSEDTIAIHLDEGAEVGCQAFLVVTTDAALFTTPIWEMGSVAGLPQPSIHSVVDVDGIEGYEILVNEAGGASTQFLGAYALREEGLIALRLPGGEGGLFAYGGSVGHLDAVDCAADGRVVVSQAVPGDTRRELEQGIYEVTRRIFEASDLTKPVDTQREEVPIDDLDRFGEFEVSPFGSCPAAP